MFCVVVGSVMNGWFKLTKRTGSIAGVRGSDRASPAGSFPVNVESNGTMPLALRPFLPNFKRHSRIKSSSKRGDGLPIKGCA